MESLDDVDDWRDVDDCRDVDDWRELDTRCGDWRDVTSRTLASENTGELFPLAVEEDVVSDTVTDISNKLKSLLSKL